MNYEKLLNLANQAKIDPTAIDEIIHMATLEIENELSKRTGKKNRYSAIQKFIKYVKKVSGLESLQGVFIGNDNHYCVSDGCGGIRFNNLDVKDLPITEGPKVLTDIIDGFKKHCIIPVELPTEAELSLSFKKQKAEKNNTSDKYSIYYKIGKNYFDPEKLGYLLSMMGENCKGFESKNKSEFYVVDGEGNELVLVPLDAEAITIREDTSS
jgi:hypothetical protein